MNHLAGQSEVTHSCKQELMSWTLKCVEVCISLVGAVVSGFDMEMNRNWPEANKYIPMVGVIVSGK